MPNAIEALQSLEAHLNSLAPVLAPSCLPSKLTQDRDLLVLSEREGQRGAQALLEVLTAAADDVEECQLCGEAGEVVFSPEAEEDVEGEVLRFTLLLRPDFAARKLLPKRALFACGLCRALRHTASLVEEAARCPRSGNGETVGALVEHLAFVNGQPLPPEGARLIEFRILNQELERGEIIVHFTPALWRCSVCWGMSGSEAGMAWLQELLCSAYALQMRASELSAWTLAGADGGEFCAGELGAAARLALALFLPNTLGKEREAALTAILNDGDGASDAKDAAAMPGVSGLGGQDDGAVDRPEAGLLESTADPSLAKERKKSKRDMAPGIAPTSSETAGSRKKKRRQEADSIGVAMPLEKKMKEVKKKKSKRKDPM